MRARKTGQQRVRSYLFSTDASQFAFWNCYGFDHLACFDSDRRLDETPETELYPQESICRTSLSHKKQRHAALPVRSQSVPLVAQRQPNARLVLLTIRKHVRKVIGHIPKESLN